MAAPNGRAPALAGVWARRMQLHPCMSPDEWSKGRAPLDGTHPIARSPWSWRFGPLAGVPIRIHITLIVLIGWIALSMIAGAVSPHATLAGVGLVALVLG